MMDSKIDKSEDPRSSPEGAGTNFSLLLEEGLSTIKLPERKSNWSFPTKNTARLTLSFDEIKRYMDLLKKE